MNKDYNANDEVLELFKTNRQNTEENPKIKIIGLGNSGINTVNRMISEGLSNVEFLLMSADSQLLEFGKTNNKILLGTEGLGTGGNPALGEKLAKDAEQEIAKAIKGADMVFITTGMGGGVSTGASPVVAKIAKELGILTVAIVTKPFSWEESKRITRSNVGIENLRKYANAVIVIENDRVIQTVEKQISLKEYFSIIGKIMLNIMNSILGIITTTGMIDVNFADIKNFMQSAGLAYVGIGQAQGENRAIKAAEKAINSQLLEISIKGATDLIVNITSGLDLTLHEIADVANVVQNAVSKDAKVIVGDVLDENFKGIKVTIIAAGFKK